MAVLEKVVKHGDVTVIFCRDRLILGETEELRSAALAAIHDTGRIVIHLSGVPYIDTTGLGLLAFLCITARRSSGDLKLVSPSRQVAEVLHITKLGRVFDVYPTEDAAVAAFATMTGSATTRGNAK